MRRQRRRGRGSWRASAVLLLPLVPAACGTEKAAVGAGAGGGRPFDRAELRQRAGEVALEHVYVTGIPGFTLARQSVGVLGNDGFTATYVSRDGGRVQLSVDRGTLPPDGCEGCVREGVHWYDAGADGGGHAYLRAEGGHVVRLVGSGAGGPDRATVKAAAEKAHRASDAEMDAVLPAAQDGTGGPTGGSGGAGGGAGDGGQVERGDLPPAGDGAPRNDVGVSG